MRTTNSISTKLLDEIVTAIGEIGVDNTIKALQDAKSNKMIMQDMSIDFILYSVSEITGIPKDRILNGNDRNDEKKIAIALCVYFIKTELSYSLSQLKRIFNKDTSALSRYHSMVEHKPSNPKTDFDKKMNQHYKAVSLLITEKNLINGK